MSVLAKLPMQLIDYCGLEITEIKPKSLEINVISMNSNDFCTRFFSSLSFSSYTIYVAENVGVELYLVVGEIKLSPNFNPPTFFHRYGTNIKSADN